jgi:hypothetical protein
MTKQNKILLGVGLIGVAAYYLLKNSTKSFASGNYRGIGALYNAAQYGTCITNNTINGVPPDDYQKTKCCYEAFGFWNGTDCVEPQFTTPESDCINSGGTWDATTSTCTCPAGSFLAGNSICTGCPAGQVLTDQSTCVSCGQNEIVVNNTCTCPNGFHYETSTTSTGQDAQACVADEPTCSQNQILLNGVCTPIDIAANIVTGYPPILGGYYGGDAGGGGGTTETPTETTTLIDYIPLILGGMTISLAIVSED